MDVKFFLRVPHDALKKRRHDRHGYHTAGERSCLFLGVFFALLAFLRAVLVSRIDQIASSIANLLRDAISSSLEVTMSPNVSHYQTDRTTR